MHRERAAPNMFAAVTTREILVRTAVPLWAAVVAAALTGCICGDRGGARSVGAAPEAPAVARGQRDFRVSCAGCHGAQARGDGPMAPMLEVPVPDLTRIAARRGGQFPSDEVFRIIDGQADLSAHGPRHMPVWGYEFFGDDADDAVAHGRATDRIEGVILYLRTLQR